MINVQIIYNILLLKWKSDTSSQGNWHMGPQEPGIILCMHPANERWRYSVTPSLIGWAHILNYPWGTPIQGWFYYWCLNFLNGLLSCIKNSSCNCLHVLLKIIHEATANIHRHYPDDMTRKTTDHLIKHSQGLCCFWNANTYSESLIPWSLSFLKCRHIFRVTDTLTPDDLTNLIFF